MYKKKVKLIKHDCLPNLMLLYIMLYIVLAYLMLFAALTNAVCLHNASFFAIDFCKCFYIFQQISVAIIRGNALAITASSRKYVQELVERH